MLKLELKTADQEHLEVCISHIIDDERDSFIEELPKWLDNDVDCSSEIEADAAENPENFDLDHEHIYTHAVLLRKAVFPNG